MLLVKIVSQGSAMLFARTCIHVIAISTGVRPLETPRSWILATPTYPPLHPNLIPGILVSLIACIMLLPMSAHYVCILMRLRSSCYRYLHASSAISSLGG